MGLSRKHFINISKHIREANMPREYKIDLASHLASYFKDDNPQFKLDKFMRACVSDVTDEEMRYGWRA